LANVSKGEGRESDQAKVAGRRSRKAERRKRVLRAPGRKSDEKKGERQGL